MTLIKCSGTDMNLVQLRRVFSPEGFMSTFPVTVKVLKLRNAAEIRKKPQIKPTRRLLNMFSVRGKCSRGFIR